MARVSEVAGVPSCGTNRRRLAQYLVQRRRGDIQSYLDTETPFPKREDREENYQLTIEYKRLFERVLNFSREVVTDTSGGRHWSGWLGQDSHRRREGPAHFRRRVQDPTYLLQSAACRPPA